MVLRRLYRYSLKAIAYVLEGFINASEVMLDRDVVEAGLEFVRNGGDFADGAAAFEGRRLGGDVFVSFDRKAVRLVWAQGRRAELL